MHAETAPEDVERMGYDPDVSFEKCPVRWIEMNAPALPPVFVFSL